MITSENNSVARESLRVILLKSRLDFTGHSACKSEFRDIFDRQTHVPNDWMQLMCSRVLQPWDRRNSMTAPVRNITAIWLFNIISRNAEIQSVCSTAPVNWARRLYVINHNRYFFFANGRGDQSSISGQVIPKIKKMVLDTSLLYIQHYKARIKGKVEQSKEKSSTLPNTSV